MNQTLKGLLVALIMFYIVSPVDAMPGPVDDVLLALLGYVGTKAIESRKKNY